MRDSGGDNPPSDYTIIYTESIDLAIEQPKAHPIIGDGSIKFTEIHKLSI